MNLQSKYLEDSSGNKYAPITTPNAVRWPDGSNLNDKLDNVKLINDEIYGVFQTEEIVIDNNSSSLDKVRTYDGGEVQEGSTFNRYHLVCQIPANAEISIECSLNFGVNCSIYSTREKALNSSTDYIQTFNNYGYAHSVSGISNSGGWLNVSYKNANGNNMTSNEVTAFLSDVVFNVSWTETVRTGGLLKRLIKVENASELFIGNVEQGERGTTSISSSSLSVAMSNTVAVPYDGCKIKAVMPDHIVAVIRYGTTSQTLGSTQNIENAQILTIPSNTQYYSINFKKKDGTAIDYQEIQRYIDNGVIMFVLTNYDGTTVVGRNSYNENVARSYMRKGGGQDGYSKNMTILHTSDLHGDVTRAMSLFEYANFINADYVVHTGDTVGWPYNGYSYMKFAADVFNFASKTINSNGNHDVFDISAQSAFENNIQPFTNAIGIETNKSYYYVDNSTYKIRFIVLDCFENALTNGHNKVDITGTQINWLISTLQSVPSGYGVILCYHIPLDTIIANNAGFYQENVVMSFDTLANYGGGISNLPIQKIINAFIRKESISGTYTSQGTTYSYNADFTNVPLSAEFICHMNGHEHSDRIGYYEGYDGNTTGLEKQLCFNVCTGNSLYGTGYKYLAHLSDCPRGGRGAVQDAFNVMTIFRATRKIQVTRIGSFVADGAERLTAEFSY